MSDPAVKIHVLAGGKLPQRQSDGAIGYDAHIRAIVSPAEKDSQNPVLRKTLFDFFNIPVDPVMASRVVMVQKEDNSGTELVYKLNPGESVLVGIGFVTEMPFPMFYWVAPRSGLASKWGITVTNAPGTVDPDYRGEAGVVVCNRSDKVFFLRHDMRIAQIIFQSALIPDFQIIENYGDLTESRRGADGFGSTGLR